MRGVTTVVVASAVLGLAGPAHAGTFTMWETAPSYGFPGSTAIVYEALAGEANSVKVTADPAAGSFTLRDAGAVVLPDPNGSLGTLERCSFVLQAVTCRPSSGRLDDITARLGDRDDRVTADVAGVTMLLDGGEGGDLLDARRAEASWLAGGPGPDVLRGGAGGDELLGGPGGDDLSGGGGYDGLFYRHVFMSRYSTAWAADDATAGIHVDLDGVADDGQPGEGDNVRGDLESFLPTEFADDLTGDGDAELFSGLAGDDRIDGGGGADFIVGLEGSDHLTGGPGADEVHGGHSSSTFPVDGPDDDVLELADGEVDHYTCGRGTDRATVDPFDVFRPVFGVSTPQDCEVLG